MTTNGTVETREVLLAVAIHEFSTKGFAGTRVDELARRAGVNKQLIYHYFGDKRGLYAAALERMIADIRQRESRAEVTDLEEVARDFMATGADPSRLAFARLVLREGMDNLGPLVLEAERRESTALSVSRIQRMLDLREDGSGVDADILYLILGFLNLGPIAVPQLVELATGQSANSEEFVSRYQDGVHWLLGLPRDEGSKTQHAPKSGHKARVASRRPRKSS